MLYYEDFLPGQEIELGGYEVSQAEIIEFASKYDPQPFHLSVQGGEASMFGGLIASGWHTASICMRLYVDAILNKSASMGSPGVDELRWKRPVRPGDCLKGKFILIDKKIFRKGIGLVRGRAELYNQDNKLVLTFIGQGMFGMKDS